jgi:hypothetical protein
VDENPSRTSQSRQSIGNSSTIINHGSQCIVWSRGDIRVDDDGVVTYVGDPDFEVQRLRHPHKPARRALPIAANALRD